MNPIDRMELTESQDVPDGWVWWGAENHVDHPKGVEDLHSHPTEGAEQGVVQQRPHHSTHRLTPNVSQEASQNEEHTEEEQGHHKTTVYWC